MLISSALQDLDPAASVELLTEHLKVSRSTIGRWLAYFRGIFPACRVWQRVRGLVSASVTNDRLPASLIQHLRGAAGGAADALRATLRLLAADPSGSPGVD